MLPSATHDIIALHGGGSAWVPAKQEHNLCNGSSLLSTNYETTVWTTTASTWIATAYFGTTLHTSDNVSAPLAAPGRNYKNQGRLVGNDSLRTQAHTDILTDLLEHASPKPLGELQTHESIVQVITDCNWPD